MSFSKSKLNKLVTENIARIKQEFANPDFEEFCIYFGFDFPESLKILYQQKEKLLKTPVCLQFGDRELVIQHFTSLCRKSILSCELYENSFYPFAAGENGESFLLQLNGSENIFVDHDADGQDIEETSIPFQQMVDEFLNSSN